MYENPDVGPEWFEQTFYHGKIAVDVEEDSYPTYTARLYTASEDGTDLVFTGQYHSREDAEAVVAAWKNEATRELMYLTCQLTPVDNEAGPKP